MRIVHLGKYFSPYYGGIETVTEDLCDGGVRQGHEVVCMVANEKKYLEQTYKHNGYEVLKLKRAGHLLSTPLCFWSAKRINAHKPDIVHLHLPNPLPLFILKKIEAPIVATYHASIVNKGLVGRVYKFIYQRQLSHIKKVIITSEKMKQEKNFVQLNIPAQKIGVIPIGIDVDSLGMVHSRPVKNDKEEFTLFFSGRFVPYKGLEYLILAMKNIPAKLHIAGSGTEEKKLKRLVMKLGLDQKIKFLGRLPRNELFSCILNCDLFVLPSINEAEAFGVSALEAMALGKPIVTTKINSGVAEINLDQQTGVLVEARSSESLVKGINKILDKNKLIRMGKKSRQRYEQNYQLDQMVSSYLVQYQSVLNRAD